MKTIKFLCLFAILLSTYTFALPQRNYIEEQEERRLGNRRRPCRFGGKGKDAEGRTFLDWNYSYVNVNNNYNYLIDCAGNGNQGGFGGGGYRPLKPQRPFQGGIPPPVPPPLPPPIPPPIHPPVYQNGPFQGFFANRPFAGLFSQSQSQSSPGQQGPQFDGTGIMNAISNVQQIGQGIAQFGQGISQNLPQLPQIQWPDFQWPQLPSLPQGIFNGEGINNFFQNLPSFDNIFNRPSTGPASVPSTPAVTPPSTTTDPDDVIYNDDKPVNEEYDPVMPDAYSNLRPGLFFNRNDGQSIYQNRYQAQKEYYDRNNKNDKFLNPESRSLKFPN